MVKRNYWINLVEKNWLNKNIIWLCGVRRVGKTFLCRSLDNIEYFDCELPSVRNSIEDTESFLKSFKGKRIVIDEIHRLRNPSELLKIAADYFPETKIIATGSSTLTANKKFKDTLTGRKKDILLTPLNYQDMQDFNAISLEKRIIKGGLPPYFLSLDISEKDYWEWIESYWAKDVEDIFGVGKKSAFLKFTELLIIRSGGIFEATSYTTQCEVSRQTIFSYLNILEETFIANVIKPFSSRRSNEIISAPKVYTFDTGFIKAFKGIKELRSEDYGFLFEHIVLNEIISVLQHRRINYWRDKQGHEIDFIITNHNGRNIAIECKWKEKDFEPKNFKVFSSHYSDFEKVVLTSDTAFTHIRKFAGVEIKFVNINHLASFLNNFL